MPVILDNASLRDRRVMGKVTGWDNNRAEIKDEEGKKKKSTNKWQDWDGVQKSQEDVWEKYRKWCERIQIYMMSYNEPWQGEGGRDMTTSTLVL